MQLHTLQYLRAFAALAVVLSHTALQIEAYAAWIPYNGHWGVDIFFVISGFIMVYIAKPDDTPARFMEHRIRRVVPLYWFFTLLMASILFFMPSLFKSASFSLPDTLKSLFFIPHWSQAEPGRVWPILAPGWSLVYEMYFYLLFALSLLAPMRFRVPLIIVSITMIFLLTRQLDQSNATVRFLAEVTVFEFVFGMLLALAYRWGGLRLPNAAGWALLIIGVLWLWLEPHWPHLFKISLPALLVVSGALFIRLPRSRLGLLLGDASYALYLVHLFVLGAVRVVVPPIFGYGATGALVFTLACLIGSAIAGVIVHLYIDNRLLKQQWLKEQFNRRSKAAGH